MIDDSTDGADGLAGLRRAYPNDPAVWRASRGYLQSQSLAPAGTSVPAKLCVDCVEGGSGSSIVVASVGRRVLPATDTETASSLLWLATIQCIESKQDLAGLAPKDCFVSAKPVERVAGQIGQTQKAT